MMAPDQILNHYWEDQPAHYTIVQRPFEKLSQINLKMNTMEGAADVYQQESA